MIHTIQLKNFKAFSETQKIPIKPITLFCGTNSSGKSTILQSLLLWKQSLESRNYDQSLLLNGRLIHLGTFSNVIHRHNENATMGFDFTYEFTRDEIESISRRFRSYPAHMIMRELVSDVPALRRIKKYRIRYSVELASMLPQSEKHTVGSVVPLLIKTEVSCTLDDGKVIPGVNISICSTGKPEEYNMEWNNISDRNIKRQIVESGNVRIKSIEFINMMPTGIEMIDEEDMSYHDALISFFRIGDILRLIFGSLTYLGPLREEPARRYIYEDEVGGIGIKGENAAYIYLSEGTKQLKNHYFHDTYTNNYIKKDFITLQESVKRWLETMGIHAFNANRENEIIRLLLNSSLHNDTQVNIADVGFGVSQVFPIVLEGLRMKPGNTLLLEQPEIHLHPKLQMQLADYIICLALSGKKVILETHSDHIVNRLVRKMIEDCDHRLKDMIAIYFVHDTNEGSVVEPVTLSETEGIVNWPDDFFDQAGIEQQLIMRAIVARRERG